MKKEYSSLLVKKMLEEMKNDPWHVKLRRWADVQKWIIYCHLFNNKFFRKLKEK